MHLISSVLVAGFIALIVAAAWHELRHIARLRRAGFEQPRHRRRLYRRLGGLLFLALSVAILLNTPTFERAVANPFYQLAWIGMAFVSVILAVWLAVRDLSETGKLAQEEAQRVVLESLLGLQGEIAKAKREKSATHAHDAPAQDDKPHAPPGPQKPRPRRHSRRR